MKNILLHTTILGEMTTVTGSEDLYTEGGIAITTEGGVNLAIDSFTNIRVPLLHTSIGRLIFNTDTLVGEVLSGAVDSWEILNEAGDTILNEAGETIEADVTGNTYVLHG